ncbi:MAG: universal stress protein [Chloroflexi bacterium]|nr:universal stress protein [Chloroflexota bacterium]
MQKILIGTDASPSADVAMEAAARLAAAQDAELLVLYVQPPLDAREVFDPSHMPDPEAHLTGLRDRYAQIKVRTRIEAGDPAETICEVAEEETVDVIVVGNRGTHGKRRWFLGSVPNAVVQHAPTSVYIVDTRSAR